MRTLFFIALIFCGSLKMAFTQDNETKARATFMSASQAYSDGNYERCLQFLDKTEVLLGASQPLTLHLKAKANYNLKLYCETKKNIVEFFNLTPDENMHQYKELLELLGEINTIELEKKSLFNKVKKDHDYHSGELFIQRYPNSYLCDYEEILPLMCELSLLELSNLEQSKYYADMYIDACNKNLISGTYREKVKQLIDKRESWKKSVAGKWSGNISVSAFSNGAPIPYAASASEWGKACWKENPAWTYYNYDKDNEKYYGKIYNYYAIIDERNICPKGSHVSTLQDWRELTTTVLAYSDNRSKSTNIYNNKQLSDWNHGHVAGFLKSSELWETKGSSDDYGFSAVPGGCLEALVSFAIALGYSRSKVYFKEMGTTGCWWLYPENVDDIDTDSAIYIEINDQDETIFEKKGYITEGKSVRCVEDKH